MAGPEVGKNLSHGIGMDLRTESMLKELLEYQRHYTDHFFDTLDLQPIEQLVKLLLGCEGVLFFPRVLAPFISPRWTHSMAIWAWFPLGMLSSC